MQYPVLDNRPINKWKVAKLKEELKSRNLVTKGLKDGLVKRLDEAIRNEKLALEAQASTSSDSVEVVAGASTHTVSGVTNGENGYKANIDKDHAKNDQWKDLQEEELQGTDSAATFREQAVPEATIDNNTHITLSEVLVSQMVPRKRTLEDNKIEMENKDLKASPKDTVMDEKPDANTNSTVNEVLVAQFPSGEAVPKDNQVEMENDVLKSSQKNNFLSGKPELLEASVTTSETTLGYHKIEVGNELLDSQQEKTVMGEQPGHLEICVESSSIANEVFIKQSALSEKKIENDNIKLDNVELKPSKIDSALFVGPTVPKMSMETSGMVNDSGITQDASSKKASEGNEVKLENERLKPLQMDAECEVSHPKNQVFEVSPNLGFQVKSESISTDTVSIYEKKELKNNLNANSVNLEPEIDKPEMVQPSSTEDPSNDDILYPLDNGIPNRKQGFVEESNIDEHKNVEFRKKNINADIYSVDVSVMEDVSENETSNKVVYKHDKNGSPDGAARPDLLPNMMETIGTGEFAIAAGSTETKLQDIDCDMSLDTDFGKGIDVVDKEQMEKVNIDQSSGDDYMEEDVLETTRGVFKQNSNKVNEKTELDVAIGKVTGTVDMQPGISSNKLETSMANKKDVLPEKRKIHDETTHGSKELLKRQRKWNSDNLNVPVPQSSTVSTASKDLLQTTRMKTNLTRSDSTLGREPPMERVVPPSPKSPSTSLRINNFLRPFTLKAVQELLAKTGNVCSYWMDHVKTHCYVTYSSVEEAIETRNAVYNLKWPPNGGRLLVAEFVDPQEVKVRVEGGPVTSAMPVRMDPVVPQDKQLPPSQPQSSTRQQAIREQTLPQHALPQRSPTADRPVKREHPPAPEKIDPPIVTLDDLFRKTIASPRIYYLPLTEEQVNIKAEHQRRGIKN